MSKSGNILTFSCTHIPFEKKGYLSFLRKVRDKYDCDNIVCLGDEVDCHSISYHEKDPSGMGGGKEVEQARKHLRDWYKAFPEMSICVGNHSELIYRKARTYGIPQAYFKTYNQIWDAPKTWVWEDDFEIHDVRFFHGHGRGGMYPHVNWAKDSRQSVVIGHFHSVAGVDWMASRRDIIYGMCVGCGVDEKSYAMAYGKRHPRRPVIGCGVILNKGKFPMYVPMPL